MFPSRAALRAWRLLSRVRSHERARATRAGMESVARGLTLNSEYVRLNIMRAARLQDALERLTAAIRDVESELAAMKAEHDPLASHIFVARRHYRNVNDTKSGKRRETMKYKQYYWAPVVVGRGRTRTWDVDWEE